MLKSILEVHNVQVLKKKQQQKIKAGSWFIDCSLSQNFQHPCCILGSSVCR